MTETLIQLQGVGKTYPGSDVAAVADLDLEIKRGEILVLVGPSGCGKSTTLRLINRMIEPTTGRIIFEGNDVTYVNPDQLRRQMGYVIQQIGLFPHRNIYQNIATVPRLLGWNNSDILERARYLLTMVGMDPDQYLGRYPKELSGGQAQRVGVARALAADPDVLLMDEPFGAIDPITRDRLQNEFLRLQEEMQKTIVFVTHDIDEAVKMGDKIAILREQSVVAQLDTPTNILASPANPFVEEFLGSGALLKGLTLARVRDIELPEYPVVRMPTDRPAVLAALANADSDWAVLLSPDDKPLRWLNEAGIERGDSAIERSGSVVRVTVEQEDTLRDALEAMIRSTAGSALVVDAAGRYQGVLTLEALAEITRHTEAGARNEQAVRRAEARGTPDQSTVSAPPGDAQPPTGDQASARDIGTTADPS
ncbi:MAG: ATP-binding cassette domain-containing protein [Candidatus Microthrix parvicella]